MRKRSLCLVCLIVWLFMLLSPVCVSANTLSLTASYTAVCGKPTLFTLQASGGTGTYVYYLSNLTRDGEDGNYFVMDPSRLMQKGYQASNRFEITFCASGTYYADFYVMDKGVSPAQTKRLRLKIQLNDPAYPSIESIADTVAAQCKARCQSNYDRALWLHDWLLDHCEYDYKNFLYCGAEGALARGIGTCEAYHRAYTMLLNRVGIQSGRMEGNGHVWTAVRIDGKWVQVDVTWDDNGYSNHTYENYLYFGLDDRIMQLVHSDHRPHTGYLSDTPEKHYLLQNNRLSQWYDPLSTAVQSKLNAGQTAFEIPISSSMPPGYKNVIYNLVAYRLSAGTRTAAGKTFKLNAAYAADTLTVTAAPTGAPVGAATGAPVPAKSTTSSTRPVTAGKPVAGETSPAPGRPQTTGTYTPQPTPAWTLPGGYTVPHVGYGSDHSAIATAATGGNVPGGTVGVPSYESGGATIHGGVSAPGGMTGMPDGDTAIDGTAETVGALTADAGTSSPFAAANDNGSERQSGDATGRVIIICLCIGGTASAAAGVWLLFKFRLLRLPKK